MNINYDYTSNFMANKISTKPNSRTSMKKFIQNKDKFCKSDIYNDIDNYLNNNISKNDFLKQFMLKKYSPNLSRAEQKHLNDLKMTIDLTNSINDIPEDYVKETLSKLLKAKKG